MAIQNEPVNIKIKKGKKVGFNPLEIISDNKFIQNMNFITDLYRSLGGTNRYQSKAKFYHNQQHRSERVHLEVQQAV
jgi:hypothetical protein